MIVRGVLPLDDHVVAVIVFVIGSVFGLWHSPDSWALTGCSRPELPSTPLTASVALPIV